ncbi:putative aarF domain-containing protein kinase 2 [Galemys pyrenaicus]|uniref:Putative aarF domain-containing protein kinase 2 n=1 Tax=Galemys pyrenaicus TaxID=202257 RepID=A0A8J6DWJ9_GALPY|nr:putative aarF domain-containing protein kinase 2 [Galemys pyrenaicus]
MVTPWRFSVRVCLWHLRGVELRKELCLLRPVGCCRNARLCWLLLGTLPKLISAYGDIGEGAPESLCQQRARWSDLAANGSQEAATYEGWPGCLLLHLRIWLRAGTLLVKFFPLLLLYPFTYLTPSISSLWLHLLLKATESSGPTYIKLGQWASTRRDLFSEAFCARFSKLHVQVAPHRWTHTEHFLRQAFGEDWEKVLCFETREPVGSGCVAQVYKAQANPAFLEGDSIQRLAKASSLWHSSKAEAPTGQRELFRHLGSWWRLQESLADQSFLERLLFPKADVVGSNAGMSQASAHPVGPSHLIPVAVKVLHPGLLSQVQMDLLLMKMGSRILSLLPGVKWLSLPEIVEEFEKLMVQQIDLRYEARNLEHFQCNFLNVNSVKFPTPLRPFVTREVLVETYEESVPVSSYQQAGIPDDLKRKIARLGINMLLKMIFVDNFVHADLHPGNILVQGAAGPPQSQEARLQQVDVCDALVVAVPPAHLPLRLVLLDAGIVAELQAADLRNFRAVFTAVALGQGQKVAELILHHARASECRDVEGFKAEMATLVNQARKNTITLEKLEVSSLLSNVFKLLMTYQVRSLADLCSVKLVTNIFLFQVKLESNFASIVFAIMVLEGLGRSLDPKLDILDAAKPFLLKGPVSFP